MGFHQCVSIRYMPCKFWSATYIRSPIRSIERLCDGRRQLGATLKSCVSERLSLDCLKEAHAKVEVSGLQSDVFINNLLLNGYSRCGHVGFARKVFDLMPKRNIISWSTIITAYSQQDRGEDALRLFSCFRECDSEYPNEFILASVLRSCAQLRAIYEAGQVHSLAVKSGCSEDVYVGTVLIDVYAKTGCVEEARSVFDVLPVKNEVTWTTMLTGYTQCGRPKCSLQLFIQMMEGNIRPDRYVISSVISACSLLELLDEGKQLHGYVLRNGIDIDNSVNNALIDIYSKCHRLLIARKIFNLMIVKNVVSWTTMISGYMQNDCDFQALNMVSEMRQQGWDLDGFACTSALTSCGSLGSLMQGKQIHCFAIKTDLESDSFVKNGLIDMYAKCDCLDEARKAFDLMADHNLISFNAMIEGYARSDELLDAIELFNKMRRNSFSPSLLTFVSLLGVSASLASLELSRQIHGLLIKSHISLDLYAGSALVDVYSKCSYVEDAGLVFEKMDDRDIVVWNAMISGYTQNMQGEKALKLLVEMPQVGLKPNEYTYVASVASASNLASLLHGLQLHAQIMKRGFQSEPYVSNALIDMYAKCGTVEEARCIFDMMDIKDIGCWNSIISKYAQHGHAEEALNMFQRLKYASVKPNYVTFVGVLSACSHAGLVEEGLTLFYSMKNEYGIEPGTDHYACIVTLLGRSRRLQEARIFIENMPIKPAAIVWRSLLSACRLVGNLELGIYAAEMAILSDPKDSGTYVLISNIFASKGMWSEVDKVRKGMDDNRVMKEPGHSWLEIRGNTHTFLASDQSHQESGSIYFMLYLLMDQLQDLGYEPESTFFVANE